MTQTLLFYQLSPFHKQVPLVVLFYFYLFLREWFHLVVLFPEMLPSLDEQGHIAGMAHVSIIQKQRKK